MFKLVIKGLYSAHLAITLLRSHLLRISENVLADTVDALDDHAVGRVDADDRGRIVDDFTLVEPSTNCVSGEDAFVGDVVDVAAGVTINQAATNCLCERHWAARQLRNTSPQVATEIE